MTNSTEPQRNIILIGFMGSGKTVIGRETARLLDMDFADTDEEIREVTGYTLPQLFRKHGEIRCRSEEKLIINKLAKRNNIVIACGGSLPPQQENLRTLSDSGWFVLLTAKPEIIKERLTRKKDRILTQGKPTPELISRQAATWEENYTPYVNYRIDSGSMDVESAARTIAAEYRFNLKSIK